MSFPAVAIQAVLVVVALVAAYYDARYRRIPNWIVLVGLVLGFGLNTFLYEWSGLALAAKGFGLGLLVYLPLYLLRAMGAGDAKLMAAVGSLLGAANWFGVFIITAVLGGIAGLIVLLVQRQVARGVWNVGFLISRLMVFEAPYISNEQLDVRSSKALRMPHGVIIAAACMLFLAAAWKWAPR
jgi:prepilin peptidase CpaA